MNFVFIVLDRFGVLPTAALITAVTLSGVAISVMVVVNIVSSISIIRRMLSAPRAYLTALVPAPRYKILFANVAAMTILDFVTMAVAIAGQVLLALGLAGSHVDAFGYYAVFTGIGAYMSVAGGILMLLAGYLLLIMFIVSCIIVRRSLFYQIKLGGLLTAAVAIGAVYLFSLSQFVLAPFGMVSRFGWFFEVQIQQGGTFNTLIYAIFLLVYVVALFIINSKLMERKLNI
jgi:hypothetical protein